MSMLSYNDIMTRAKKLDNVAVLAKNLMQQGSYIISQQAKLRQGERYFTLGDIKNIVENGFHEKKKDEYKEEYGDWNYAIRGHTLDHEEARVCIAFIKESHLVVITVIRLGG